MGSKLHYKLYYECKDGSRSTNTMGFEKEITKASDLIAVHQKMFGYEFLKNNWDCNKDFISPSEVVVCKEK